MSTASGSPAAAGPDRELTLGWVQGVPDGPPKLGVSPAPADQRPNPHPARR
jgi:hypothetical protein